MTHWINQERENVSWRKYIRWESKLINKCKQLDPKPDVMLGIARGGALLSLLMSYELRIPICFYNKDMSVSALTRKMYRIVGKHVNRVLIVDDVCDSGHTFEELNKKLPQPRWMGMDKVFVSLVYKPWSVFLPNFYIHRTERWVIFPYEENRK